MSKISIYSMTKEELYIYCKRHCLGEEDCRIAYFLVYEQLKGKIFYEAIGYSEAQSKRKRKKILEKLIDTD